VRRAVIAIVALLALGNRTVIAAFSGTNRRDHDGMGGC
jgi:hypothetical protein